MSIFYSNDLIEPLEAYANDEEAVRRAQIGQFPINIDVSVKLQELYEINSPARARSVE